MAYIDSSTNNPSSLLPGPSKPSPDGPRITEVPNDDDTESEEESSEEGVDLVQNLIGQIDKINIAEDIDEQELNKLGALVVREYEVDENSRSDWKDEAEQALKFANQEAEPKQYPWPKASSVIYPLITSAALQFAARTYPAIIQNRNVVKGVVWGSDKGTPVMGQDGQPMMGPDGQPVWLEPPGAKRLRADRIGGHMSYQLLEEMPEWEPQVDTLLHMIPIVGGAARKTYYDPIEDRNYSLLVSLLDLVWNFHAKSFESAPRHTELLVYYPVEIEEFERAGLFLEIEYGLGDATSEGTKGGGGDAQDDDAPYLFLEQHRTYDLDGDGYPEPYVVTVHKKSAKVVRIVARYDADGIIAQQEEDSNEQVASRSGAGEQKIVKIKPVEHYTLIPFMPNPNGGSYPMGFGKLLRPLNESINTSLNQMFDAGHLQNAGGGFIGTSLSIASGPVSFQVGKYIPVNNKGQAIRDAVFPLPFPGPSGVLFQLLGTLLQAGKDVASIQDVMTGDSSMANQPPTTILALIEQGMKLYTAIHKRVYRALKSEFNKLYRLNRKRIQKAERYRVGDEWLEVTPDDYRQGGGVEPIADPTMVTDMQKLGRAQILMQFINDPLINQIELRRRFLDAAMFDRIDELLITQPQMSPADQLKMQEIQVNISRQRAAELKDTTQAVLNLAQSRKIADEKEMAWIDQQLEVMKMHVEAANTMVKAADVELRSRDRVHATRVGAHVPGTAEAKKAASNVVNMEPTNSLQKLSLGNGPAVPIQSSSPTSGQDIGNAFPGRASGGPVNPGQPYTVGEKGPETFVPNQSGTIVPNSPWNQAVNPTDDTPALGTLFGTTHLNSEIAPNVAQGAPRPLAPGEYIQNPNGGWSSEISLTVPHPIKSGKWTNIPSVWIVNGVPKRLSQEQSIIAAKKSGLTWPEFSTAKVADKVAADREDEWQRVGREGASKIKPLWDVK